MAHAQVSIELFPEPDDTKDGQTVRTWDTPSVASDADGRWAVRIDPDTIPSTYFPASQHFLNFDLAVMVGKEIATYSDTLWLLHHPRVWRTENARPGDAVMSIELDATAKTIATRDSQGRMSRSRIPMG